MLVSAEFADAGTKTRTHRVLVVGGCSDAAHELARPPTVRVLEGDMIVNSVNTLREQILQWQERRKTGRSRHFAGK